MRTLASQKSRLGGRARAPELRLHRDSLIEALAADGVVVSKDGLEVRFSRLRAKLSAIGVDEPVLKSVRGWGYQCCVPLVLSEPGAAATTGA